MEEENGCTTPKNHEYQIPAVLICPPPPRKTNEQRTKREPPRNGYFQSPELDNFLSGAAAAPAQSRQAWA